MCWPCFFQISPVSLHDCSTSHCFAKAWQCMHVKRGKINWKISLWSFCYRLSIHPSSSTYLLLVYGSSSRWSTALWCSLRLSSQPYLSHHEGLLNHSSSGCVYHRRLCQGHEAPDNLVQQHDMNHSGAPTLHHSKVALWGVL